MRTPNSGSAALTVNPGSTLFNLAVEQYVRHSPQAFARLVQSHGRASAEAH